VTTVLKLGGSVITEKDTPETLDEPALERAVETIATELPDSLVLVHGGGSFGHHHASEQGISRTAGSHETAGIWTVHEAMKTLNKEVISQLQTVGVPALPVHPLSLATRDASGALTLSTTAVRTMLEEGFVPVLHGDVLTHATEGATILSGDELVTTLARTLPASRVGLCSTVPGVLDGDNRVISELTGFDDVADALGDSESTDVTGGMAAKVRALLELDMPASVFGLDELDGFLEGERTGTLIHGA